MAIEVAALSEIYAELYPLIGEEGTRAIHQQERGAQVTFPSHFYDRVRLVPILKQAYNVHELANRYGYSERWIRRAVKTEKR
ncbi:hypothetical protein C5Z25_05065 [Lactobacillus sp. CBA3605]|uniref:hypothetical protein n=1 Tax=Lactobacillus sp. CBA3605 TaxID=2099788 RepID=UPI000CFB9C4D|nr:hypothetical protein [Lactobacillus sp. CBA3605]AVK61171.1 hypothetical protein C5Z25_05065 [Lactobacillus sp. CBA3605]